MPKKSNFVPEYVPEIMASTETTVDLAARLGMDYKLVAKIRRNPKYAHLKSNRRWVIDHHPWRGPPRE